MSAGSNRFTGRYMRSACSRLGALALVMFFTGCSTQTVVPPAHFHEAAPRSDTTFRSTFPAYKLRGGDQVEIIYQIRAREIDEYRLNIQDIIELRFVSLPHLNQDQVIRADGLLTLPLVGDIRVLGITPSEATKRIRQKYIDTLREPDVYLIVKEFGAATKELKKVITTNSRGQSKLLTVRPDGMLTLPIIGEMQASGIEIPDLSKTVNTEYQKLYPELQVDVILLKAVDQFIYVLGSVGNPGAYTIRRPMTIGQVLALAGGNTTESRITDIIIARQEGGELVSRAVDYKAVLEGRGNALQAFLQPDDILYVPNRPLASNAQISREIADLLLFNGFSYSLGSED